MARTELVLAIPAGLNGPAGSANGGVAAGLVAQLIAEPAQVRLHRPPPISTPMAITTSGDGVVAAVDGEAVMTATATRIDLEIPEFDVGAATAMTSPSADHAAPTCVVCGPDHPTPMGVFPGQIPGTHLWAAAWQPPAWTAGEDGHVRPELLWGALDCPGGFAVSVPSRGTDGEFFPALGTIAADLRAPVPVGDTVVIVAWPLGRQDRKVYAGTAIIGRDGSVRAVAQQTCIAVPIDWARS